MNLHFNRSGSLVPILITLITKKEVSEELLMEVEVEFGKLLSKFHMIVQGVHVTVKRFG